MGGGGEGCVGGVCEWEEGWVTEGLVVERKRERERERRGFDSLQR